MSTSKPAHVESSLLEIGEVAQASQSGALFLIDEMHNLDTPALAAICIAFAVVGYVSSRRSQHDVRQGRWLHELGVRG